MSELTDALSEVRRFEPIEPPPDRDPERKAFGIRPLAANVLMGRTRSVDEHLLDTYGTGSNENFHTEGHTTAELEDLFETLGLYLGRI